MAYQSKVLVHGPEEGYNLLAKKYKGFHDHLDGFDNGLLGRIIPRDLEGEKILDIGAGDGRLYKFFREKKFEEFVAFDIASELLSQHPKANNVKTIVGDLNEKLDFQDEYFDIVLSYFVLEHLRDLDEVFAEIYRILRSGGMRIIGHFMQRREVVFQNGKEKFKIQQYRRRKEEIIQFAEDNFFNIHIQEVMEKGNLLGWIFILRK